MESCDLTPGRPDVRLRGRPAAPGRVAIVLLAAAVGAGPARGEEVPADEPPILRAVAFEGRRTLPEEALLGVAGLRADQRLLRGDAERALRNLLRYPYLAGVDPPRIEEVEGGVRLVFRIEEATILRGTEILGNRMLDSARLIAAAGLRPGAPVRRQGLEEAGHAIVEAYHREGFLVASARVHLRPLGGNRADVVVEVSEGRRAYLSEVAIDGLESISRSRALDLLGVRPRRLFGLLSSGVYVPEDLPDGLERLRAHYRTHGRLSASVGLGGLELDSRLRKARLRILVREGPRYVVSSVRVEGGKLFPEKELQRAVGIASGEPHSAEAIERAQARLRALYVRRSDRLPAISVRTVYSEGDSVGLVFEIQEEKFVETGTVSISGNRLTRDRVIRNQVALVPGEPFDPDQVQETVDGIRSLRYFGRVEVSVDEKDAPDRPDTSVSDVRIEVDEPDRFGSLVEVGGGASSGSGVVGYVSIRRANFDLLRLPSSWTDWSGAFTGGGQYLDFTLLPGTEESQYGFRFEEPYLFRSDLSLSIDGGINLYERTTYEESRVGGSIRVGKYFDVDRLWSARLGWTVDRVRIDDLEPAAPPDVLEAAGATFLSYPRLELRHEDRDANDYSGPVGLLAKVWADSGLEWTGSDLDFARAGASADWRVGLFEERPDWRHVLQLGVRFQYMVGLRDEGVPLFERFYLGGPRSFRGFEYRRMGPHQGDVPVGGQAAVNGTVQYSFPLLWREIRGVAVFDWGDLEPELRDLSWQRFRTAAGGGIALRLKLLGQMVPANFYWVTDLSSEEGDRTQLFSFTLGTDF